MQINIISERKSMPFMEQPLKHSPFEPLAFHRLPIRNFKRMFRRV